MATIYESKYFIVQSANYPLVDRADGGHITIDAKFKISTRQELTAEQAIELMRLTMVAGEAMTIAMNNQGVDIGRVNYQDNGNWAVFAPEGPQLHYHLYGRAKSAVHQKYGQSLFFPHKAEHPEYYEPLKPLTEEDEAAIAKEMNQLFQEDRYTDQQWGLLNK